MFNSLVRMMFVLVPSRQVKDFAVSALAAALVVVGEFGLQFSVIQDEPVGKEGDVAQMILGQQPFNVEIQSVAQDGDGDVVFSAIPDKGGEMGI